MKSHLSALRLKRLGLTAGVLAAGAILYFTIDPLSAPWMPKCSFKLLTGLDCPGCGAQRMIHALMHLNIVKAFEANPFLFCFLPYLLLWFAVEADPSTSPRLHRFFNSLPTIITLLILIILWGILRNILKL